MTWVRRVPPVDELSRDGERLVLTESRAVRVVGLGPVVLDLTEDWVRADRLAALVTAQVDGPADTDIAQVLAQAIDAMSAEGLVEVSPRAPDQPGAGDPR